MKKTNIEAVRKWLKSYRLNVKEIQARTEHIRWLKDEMYQPLMETGRGRDKHTAKIIDQIMSGIIRDSALRLAQIRYEVEIIEKEINQLDHYERCILYNRYILGTPWVDLPDRVGYEIAQCQRIERRAIAQLAQLPRVQYFLNQYSAATEDKSVNDLTFSEDAAVV